MKFEELSLTYNIPVETLKEIQSYLYHTSNVYKNTLLKKPFKTYLQNYLYNVVIQHNYTDEQLKEPKLHYALMLDYYNYNHNKEAFENNYKNFKKELELWQKRQTK